MKKKILIIKSIILIIGFVLGITIAICQNKIIMTINQPNNEITVYSEYKEDGVNCKEGNIIKGYHKCSVKEEGNVDTTKIGTYQLTYTYKNKKIVKKVIVTDKEKPIIDINEDSLTVCPNAKLEDMNLEYTAKDNYDGDITEKVTLELIDNILTFKVSDSSKNETTIIKNIIQKDETKPSITLKGNNPIYLLKGEKYSEPGYTIKDDCDKNIENKISIKNDININEKGTYYVTYNVTDDSNNSTTIKRKVIVIEKMTDVTIVPNGKTIYLTFDDGPGRYTNTLLDILKKYNVKATFFVTNQFPSYKNCIKRAYNEGHGIALHTYTHQWTIYKSRNTYFDDLNKINNLVKSLTGTEPKILRFAGGSGNTVSMRYNKGIMSNLTKEVQLLGYKYFDWNVDCGDTKTTNSTTVANNVINYLKNNKQTNIVLLHDIKKHTIDAIERIITYGLANDFTFAPLTETSPTVHSIVRN